MPVSRATESGLPYLSRDCLVRGEASSDFDGRSDCVGDLLPIGTAKPGASIPCVGSRKVPVIALRYVVQGRCIHIEVGVNETGASGFCCIDARDEPCP